MLRQSCWIRLDKIIQLMSKVRADQFPKYPTAGLKRETEEESTASCLQPPARDVSTPQQILKYRKSFKEQAGVSIKHYGLADDKLPGDGFTYGVQTEKSEGVHNIMKAGQREGVSDFVNSIQQSKYNSFKKEPLAKAINRQYKMPETCQQEEFKFGLPTEKNMHDAKDTIYSGVNMMEQEQVRKMYLKSHQDYDPGEQKKRPYNWPVDPADFRFGSVEKNAVHNELKQILAPESHGDAFPQTKFVKRNLNDFLDKKTDKLGQSLNLGQKQFPQDKVFGVRIQPNEWDAGKCLRGEATMYEVRQDDDLGKCVKQGCRNITKQGDEQRVFGVATIRYDIKKPERQSVADPNNYADQTTAIELLFPKQFTSFGVDDEDFDKPRPKQEIKEIFENIGFHFKQGIFEAIFSRAKAIHGTILDKVSCRSFKASLSELRA